MEIVIVKIVRENEKMELPTYETPGAAGMDIRANITEPIVLGSLERTVMEIVIVKIVRENEKMELPTYETPGAAGMDIRANITEPIVLGSLERTLVPTGLKIAIPEGYEVQVRQMIKLNYQNMKHLELQEWILELISLNQ